MGIELQQNELLVTSFRANHTQGRRAVGGSLHLTTQRVVFRPHIIDRATGGTTWEAPLSAITDVSVAPKGGGGNFDGSLRDRLAISTGLDTSLFVVNKLPDVIAKIDFTRSDSQLSAPSPQWLRPPIQ
jgi:hypothetical protein